MEPLNDLIRQAAKVHGKPVYPCVSGEQLDAFYSGSLPVSEIRSIRTHLGSCPACLELARDYCRFAGLKPPGAPRENRALGFVFKPAFRIAAVLIVMVSAGAFWALREEPVDTVTMRGAASEAIELIAPKGSLSQPPALLEWKEVAGTSRYDVEILDMNLNVLWRGQGITVTKASIPAETLQQLRGGNDYGWRVTAIASNGRRSSSAVETFRLDEPQR
jgi:hypothetical protein